MIGIGVKRTSGSSSTFSLNSISALLQSNERFVVQDDPNPITPSFTLSRPDDGVSNPSMWVAPCAVVFAADATTDTAVTLPYHECFYYWDYGDSAQETEYWQYGARPGTQSKNHDRGPIGGHVYTEPGEYTVTLHVLDAFGNYNTASQTITVTDPDVIFAGAKTICMSNDANFDGAPAGAVLITTDNVNGGAAYGTHGIRYLYKRGHTFNATALYGYQIINHHDVQFASFGDPGQPKPVLVATVADCNILNGWGKNWYIDNYQVYDLKFTNPLESSTVRGFGVANHANSNSIFSPYGHITTYNCEFDGMPSPGLGGWGSATVDCYADVRGGAGVVGAWGGNVREGMWLGNYINNHGRAEHSSRVQGGKRCFFAHCDLRDPSANGKHAMTWRGSSISSPGTVLPRWEAGKSFTGLGDLYKPTLGNETGYVYRVSMFVAGVTKETDTTEPVWPTVLGEIVIDNGIEWTCEFVDSYDTTPNNTPVFYVSEFHNVQDNLFANEVTGEGTGFSGSSYLTQIATSNITTYQLTEDMIWEGNLYQQNGNTRTGVPYIQLYINYANRISVRNNLINYSKPMDNNSFGITVAKSNTVAGVPDTNNIWIYNNSFYSSDATNNGAGSKKTCINLESMNNAGLNFVIKNNLFYGLNAATVATIDDSTNEAIISNNSTLEQAELINPFAVADPLNADDYKLAAGVYAEGGGVNIDSMFIDFCGTTRDRTSFDMGAISKDS
jgi:hypothetical protein